MMVAHRRTRIPYRIAELKAVIARQRAAANGLMREASDLRRRLRAMIGDALRSRPLRTAEPWLDQPGNDEATSLLIASRARDLMTEGFDVGAAIRIANREVSHD